MGWRAGTDLRPGRDEFLRAVHTNPWVVEVVGRARGLGLEDCYLAAGCLFQTVWNVLDGHDPGRGINDYDLIYFDPDTSWDAKDAVIKRCAALFADLPVVVEVRNQARVHLWFEDHFGVPYPALASSAEAIDRYAAPVCQFGLRVDGRAAAAGDEVYAPSGYDDLFGFVMRPNPVVATRGVYETKAARWTALWPRLQVLPWPSSLQEG